MAESKEIKENSKDIKVKSFRIDNETAQKFKDIADSMGTNQQDTMQLLINAYCMQQEKAALTDYKADLERIEGYTTAILQMYTTSLQANKDVKETVKADFEALLKSKDVIIQELQTKLADAKTVKEESVAKANELEQTTEDLQHKLTALQLQLSDKDNLNMSLLDSCNNLKSKVSEMEESIKANAELKAELESKSTEIAKLQAQIEKAQNEALMSKQQAEIDIKVAVLGIKEEYQAKIEAYQKKYTDLLELINSNSNNNKASILDELEEDYDD